MRIVKTAPALTAAPVLTADRAAQTAYLRRTDLVLRDIIADADQMEPRKVAGIIRDAQWHGEPDNVDNTAVGNYIAEHLLLAGVAPAITVWLSYDRVMVLNTRTRAVIADRPLTGTLLDTHLLIDEGATGFGDLHDPTEVEPEPLGAADLAEIDATGPLDDLFTTDDDPEFFPYITALRASIAA